MRRLAAISIFACAIAWALSSLVPPAAHADPTAVQLIACENLAPYVDGNAGDVTTPEDLQAACVDPLPPEGEKSVYSLEFALGGQDARLSPAELAPLDILDGNRLPAGCTYNAVVVQQSRPAAGCVLIMFVFVDDIAPVTADLVSNLALVEAGGPSDYSCTDTGTGLGEDDDCPGSFSPPPAYPDGAVLFHVLAGPTAVDGAAYDASGRQEDVEIFATVNISSATRTLADSDGDSVPFASDNCPIHPNATQLNTDAAPIVTPGFPNDVTTPLSDILGDACDRDDDNDGIEDAVEPQLASGGISPPPATFCPGATGPTSPVLADTDGDRVLDGAECALFSNPLNGVSRPMIPAPLDDPDGDGLPSNFEDERDFNSQSSDSDGDRIPDGVEFKAYNTSPQHPNSDGDSCDDAREIASIDGNTVVNILDILIVSSSIVNNSPHARADVDRNLSINVIDLLIVAANFNGTPC